MGYFHHVPRRAVADFKVGITPILAHAPKSHGVGHERAHLAIVADCDSDPINSPHGDLGGISEPVHG